MLPGFRFLFAAIVLSMSVLVFGLGATAVLRAAHEQFAESGSWRPAPEASVAQQSEIAKPVLALLRVDPQAAEPKTADAPVATARAQGAEIASPPPEPDTTAAQDTTPPPETGNTALAATEPATTGAAKLELRAEVMPDAPKANDERQPAVVAAISASQEPARPEAPAAQPAAAVEVPAPADTNTRAAAPSPPAAPAPTAAPRISPPPEANEPAELSAAGAAPAAPEAAPPTAPEPSTLAAADPATARIATLGGPPVTIEEPAQSKSVLDQSEARMKEWEKERARRRRLAAQRARLAQQAAQAAQRAAYPFGQPNQTVQYVQPGLPGATTRTR